MKHPWRRLLSRLSRLAANQLDALDFLERENAAAMVPQRVLDLNTLERRILLNAVPASAIEDASLVAAAAQPTLAEMAVVATQASSSADSQATLTGPERDTASTSRHELVVVESGIEDFDELLSELR